MNFNKRHFDAGQSVTDGNARMRIRACIDNDSCSAIGARSVDSVDQDAFVIRLECFKAES